MKILFTHEFGRAFVPGPVRPGLRRYLFKAGITKEPYSFFGIMFYLGLFTSIIIHLSLIYPLFIQLKNTLPKGEYLLVIGLGTFLSIAFMLFFL